MEAVNNYSIKQKWNSYKKDPLSLLLFTAVSSAALIIIGLLILLIGYILIKGIPNLTPEIFQWEYTRKNVSMMPAIINTLVMTLLSLIIAAPLGIFSAIYLAEYAKRGNKFVTLIGITSETLAGIPSIVYGLFGYLMFSSALNFGYSMLSGALTLSIMVLPTIMRTTEEALKSVPDSYREGSFALGAGKLRTVFKVILPPSMPGILSGIILSIGRMVGETAALIYTAGTAAGISQSLMSSGRTLSVHMYALLSEGLYMEQAYATAVVLLVMVSGINFTSSLLAKKLVKR
ncbi:phosphate ABC transporter permease PstA [Clostridium polynesiense]|uniref:phosphate ABC transporter permease PstA n=1 Tax=Clostridium polynesiense TaxID=1325933 RepID=UPI00058C1778|nr:phosphate ABC transporter permease PstA [Clostridium polynesiense]